MEEGIKMKLIKFYNQASEKERFEFFAELDNLYDTTRAKRGREYGKGLIILYRSFMRKIAEIENKKDIKVGGTD